MFEYFSLHKSRLFLIAGVSVLILLSSGCGKDDPHAVISMSDSAGQTRSQSRALIVETYDGGQTWEAPCIFDGAATFVAGDDIYNSWGQDIIVAAGSDRDGIAAIFRTVDYGNNWDKVCGDYYDIHYVNDLATGSLVNWAVAVGDLGAVFQTRNAGASWSQKNSDTTSHLYAVDFYRVGFGPLEGFAVGEKGTIIRSQDAGDTWSQLNSPTACDLTDVRAVGYFEEDEGLVVIVGYEGTILRSEDTGNTWTEQQIVTLPDFNAVYFNELEIYGGFGIAVAQGGQIYKSTDDGITWDYVTTFPGIPLYDVLVTSEGDCIAVGKHHILYSPDQGETWSIVLVDNAARQYFYGVHLFNDSSYGFVVGKIY